MKRAGLVLLTIALLSGAVAALAPEELSARRTVGHQGRALRLRRIVATPEPHGPRLCDKDEIPTDRDPCIVASRRAAF